MAALEDSYLSSDDPIAQSGFGGGAARWRAEREPILTAVDHDGDFLDVPTDHWAAPWIEQLAAEGITSGCGGGNYCPVLGYEVYRATSASGPWEMRGAVPARGPGNRTPLAS